MVSSKMNDMNMTNNNEIQLAVLQPVNFEFEYQAVAPIANNPPENSGFKNCGYPLKVKR